MEWLRNKMGGCKSIPQGPGDRPRSKSKRRGSSNAGNSNGDSGDSISPAATSDHNNHNNGSRIKEGSLKKQHGAGAGEDGGGGGAEASGKGSRRATTTGAGKGSGRKGTSELEEEKKAISDNVRGGQFLDYYFVGPEIGRGGYSTVYEVTSKATNERCAVKCIEKRILEKGRNIKLLRREIDNMLHVDHPNVLKLMEIFEDDKWFYMVMEYMQGGELFEKIVQRGRYSERDAAQIFKQIVCGVQYLHDKGIAHRDLKPENVLSADNGDGDEKIKIADFGFSKAFDESTLRTSCGSPNYVAPEILTEDHYDKSVDIWSLGVILYILLCGYPPFYAKTNPELFKKIMACQYDFNDKRWLPISESAKDLIGKLLVRDPEQRPSAQQILMHPWITTAELMDGLESSSIDLVKLAEYNVKRKEEKAELVNVLSAPI